MVNVMNFSMSHSERTGCAYPGGAGVLVYTRDSGDNRDGRDLWVLLV